MWNHFIAWSGIAVTRGPISATYKARIIARVLPLMFRRHLMGPVIAELHRRLPVWCLKLRLRRYQGDWWVIPGDDVGVHASRRLGGRGWIEGDLIRIVDGQGVAYGWVEDDGTLESEIL